MNLLYMHLNTTTTQSNCRPYHSLLFVHRPSARRHQASHMMLTPIFTFSPSRFCTSLPLPGTQHAHMYRVDVCTRSLCRLQCCGLQQYEPRYLPGNSSFTVCTYSCQERTSTPHMEALQSVDFVPRCIIHLCSMHPHSSPQATPLCARIMLII
jgi:hypothetical protein